MLKHLNIKIYGRVQGINYRSSVKIWAQELGIKGFVRNEPDGIVYTEAEGDEKILRVFLDKLHNGLSYARIDMIKTEPGKMLGYQDFSIQL